MESVKALKMWGVYVFLMVACRVIGAGQRSQTVWELIYATNRLREVANMISKHDLTSYFESPYITAFVPTTEAFLSFDSMKYGLNLETKESARLFFSYHIAKGEFFLRDVKDNVNVKSLSSPSLHLYFNSYAHGSSEIHTVNGATIITADIEASNGILHIIDRVIAPVGCNKTLAVYMSKPDLTSLSFSSITKASIIDPELREATNKTTNFFTAFAPNDSFLMPMPDYGQDRLFNDLSLLKKVIQAHTVRDRVQFIPSVGAVPPCQAIAGTLTFTRYRGQVFVTNNKVRARVVQPNIPVNNGVIHVIDSMLYYIYMNVIQKAQDMSETSMLGAILNKLPSSIKSSLESIEVRFTIFAPTDEAFAKIPLTVQQQMEVDVPLLSKVIGGHVISGMELEFSQLTDNSTFLTIDNKTVTVRHINGDVYIEGGNIRSKITVYDLGCTNGIIHLISNVLFLNNATVWETIQGNGQLSQLSAFINQYPELRHILQSDTLGSLTVFLPSDAAMTEIPPQSMEYLLTHPDVMLDAVNGEIVQSHEHDELSSSDMKGAASFKTLGKRMLDISTNADDEIIVEGSHITAKVVVRDIWCSNGILHIVDNLLHVPTRNIVEEISRRLDISIMSTLLTVLQDVFSLLTSSAHFTVFVPSNEVFNRLSREKAEILRTDFKLLRKIINAHIVPGVTKFIGEFQDRDSFYAEEGVVYILKKNGNTFAVNNNVRATITTGNIRATNGIIHVIDTLLYYPFYTVQENMMSHTQLRGFHNFIKMMPEFKIWAPSNAIQLTLFVPSTSFLQTLTPDQLKNIETSSDTLRKLFMGHVIPGARLDNTFLRGVFRDSYTVKSRYDYAFHLKNESSLGTFVDVGYENLRHRVDLIADSVGCSNGVIYIIHGFLNLALRPLLDEMRKQPLLQRSVDQLLNLLPAEFGPAIQNIKHNYTILAPSDEATHGLSARDMHYIYNVMNDTEQCKLLWRHVINGTIAETSDLMQNHLSPSMHSQGVSVFQNNHGIYVSWKHIEARVVMSNVLASNGIIHIIDKLLFSSPFDVSTTPTPIGATKASKISAASNIHKYTNSLVLILCTLSLFTNIPLVLR